MTRNEVVLRHMEYNKWHVICTDKSVIHTYQLLRFFLIQRS